MKPVMIDVQLMAEITTTLTDVRNQYAHVSNALYVKHVSALVQYAADLTEAGKSLADVVQTVQLQLEAANARVTALEAECAELRRELLDGLDEETTAPQDEPIENDNPRNFGVQTG